MLYLLFALPFLVLGCRRDPGVQVYDQIVIDTWCDPFAANDTYLTLIDAGGNVLAENDDDNPAQGTYNVGCSRIDYTLGLTSGTYYVKVHKPTDTGNPNYGFRVVDYDPGTSFAPITPADEDETGVYFDDSENASGVPTAPVDLALGQVESRSIFPADDKDWYKIVLP